MLSFLVTYVTFYNEIVFVEYDATCSINATCSTLATKQELKFVGYLESSYLHLHYEQNCGLHCSVGYNTTLLQAL